MAVFDSRLYGMIQAHLMLWALCQVLRDNYWLITVASCALTFDCGV